MSPTPRRVTTIKGSGGQIGGHRTQEQVINAITEETGAQSPSNDGTVSVGTDRPSAQAVDKINAIANTAAGGRERFPRNRGPNHRFRYYYRCCLARRSQCTFQTRQRAKRIARSETLSMSVTKLRWKSPIDKQAGLPDRQTG